MIQIKLKFLFPWLVPSLVLCLPITTSPVEAQQIVPDNTLPTNSIVTPQGNINIIDGGTQAGGNLFHSFREFSIPSGVTAFFNNNLNIQNILTRVTGSSASDINGILKTAGNTNLFFINPNGIIFGRDARLDITGSFIGSTAGSITFADGSQFSAVNPQGTSLLSIGVPLGLQFPGMPASIINRSSLQVSPGKTIALVGGDMTLEGGQLLAPGGRIELGSVGGTSLVSLNPTTNGWTLGYGGVNVNNLGNIQLLSQSRVSADSGEIQVRGGGVRVAGGSKISVETSNTADAGKITIEANSLEVNGASADGLIFSTIAATSRGLGNSGNINITTNRLVAKDGGDISVTTFNSGKGGSITVNASEIVELTGARNSPNGQDFSRSGLFAATEGTKDGGSITVTTPRLVVSDGARISVSTRGRGENGIPGGKGGNLTVNARDSIDLSGTSADGRFPSGLFALSGEARPNIAENEATGRGGDINIQTGQLNIRDGSQVSTATAGSGKGGNISVMADAINITGASNVSQSFSTLAADSRGTGDSGDITIKTRQLKVTDGADVSVTAFERGGSGEIKVDASELVELIGAGAIPNTAFFSRSGLFAATEGTKPGGSITVTTPRLVVSDGARISVSTRGRGENGIPGGKGGNLTVNVRDVIDLSGTSADGRFPSGLFALSGEVRPNIAENEATGRGGDINIQTGQLNIRDGSEVSTATAGSGQGGNISVMADAINITGASNVSQSFSTLAADSRGTGDSGDITIKTRQLKVSDGADISVTAFGRGGSGEIKVDASELVELIGAGAIPNSAFFSRSGLFAATEGIQDGGSITVTTPRLAVRDGARISVSTRGRGENGIPGGKGGNLTVNARDSIDLSGVGQVQLLRNGLPETRTFNSGLFALSGEARPNIVENEATGQGGGLEINTGLLNIRDRAQVSVSASGQGPAGNLEVKAGSIKLRDGSIIGLTQLGSGANIELFVQDSLQLLGDSRISATAARDGNGGNITIGSDTLAVLNTSSIRANAGRQGGRVDITTQALFVIPNSISATSESGAEFNGVVTINTPNIESGQELIDIPTNFLTSENQVAQNCTREAGKNRSQFVITGRGGLPPTPEEPLTSEVVRGNSIRRSPNSNNLTNNLTHNLTHKLPQPATGLAIREGQVVLTADTNNSINQSSRLPTANCHVR